MTLGFTGTQRGMTQRQRAAFRYLLRELNPQTLHLGDCTGSDAEAHQDSVQRGIKTIGHPPVNDRKRAFCKYDEEWAPQHYLIRDKDIVGAGIDGLIATPRQMTEPFSKRGEGTWTTVVYARKAGRRIWIVFPDGTFKEEPARLVSVCAWCPDGEEQTRNARAAGFDVTHKICPPCQVKLETGERS